MIAPWSVSYPCTDAISDSPLSVPLISQVDAKMITPLTTIATFLLSNFGMSDAAASEKIWRSMSIASQSVWNFNALLTALTSVPVRWRLVDMLWVCRQTQSLNTVTLVAQRAFDAADAAGLAGFAALARMVNSGPVDLTAASNITVLIHYTGEELEMQPNQVEATASACAEENQATDAEIRAASAQPI